MTWWALPEESSVVDEALKASVITQIYRLSLLSLFTLINPSSCCSVSPPRVFIWKPHVICQSYCTHINHEHWSGRFTSCVQLWTSATSGLVLCLKDKSWWRWTWRREQLQCVCMEQRVWQGYEAYHLRLLQLTHSRAVHQRRLRPELCVYTQLCMSGGL